MQEGVLLDSEAERRKSLEPFVKVGPQSKGNENEKLITSRRVVNERWTISMYM